MCSFGLFFNDLSLVTAMEAKGDSLMLLDNKYISHCMPREDESQHPKDLFQGTAGGCGTRCELPALLMAESHCIEKGPAAGPFPSALGSHLESLVGRYDASMDQLREW